MHFTAATGKVQVVDSGGGFSPVDCCCFLEPATLGACGNTGWDSYPPYGGVGETPDQYIVTITDIPAIQILGGVDSGSVIPDKINGTHILRTQPIGTAFFCEWNLEIPLATTTGKTLIISVDLSFSGFLGPEVSVHLPSPSSVFDFPVRIDIDHCELFGSEVETYLGDDYTVEWNPN
jgi:hypothetical protein